MKVSKKKAPLIPVNSKWVWRFFWNEYSNISKSSAVSDKRPGGTNDVLRLSGQALALAKHSDNESDRVRF